MIYTKFIDMFASIYCVLKTGSDFGVLFTYNTITHFVTCAMIKTMVGYFLKRLMPSYYKFLLSYNI